MFGLRYKLLFLLILARLILSFIFLFLVLSSGGHFLINERQVVEFIEETVKEIPWF
jgi:hypothetical protein